MITCGELLQVAHCGGEDGGGVDLIGVGQAHIAVVIVVVYTKRNPTLGYVVSRDVLAIIKFNSVHFYVIISTITTLEFLHARGGGAILLCEHFFESRVVAVEFAPLFLFGEEDVDAAHEVVVVDGRHQQCTPLEPCKVATHSGHAVAATNQAESGTFHRVYIVAQSACDVYSLECEVVGVYWFGCRCGLSLGSVFFEEWNLKLFGGNIGGA